MKYTRLVGMCVGLLLCWGCGGSSTQPAATDATSTPQSLISVASDIAKDVAAVGVHSGGESPKSIFVLEELHNSRAGQIQHAIVMVRLHDRHGLKVVGLEGYLKERPAVDVRWFGAPRAKSTPLDRARVTVRLLKEGEISAAEFMALTYDDVAIVPVESRRDYDVALTDGAVDAASKLASQLPGDVGQRFERKMEDASTGKAIVAEEHLALAEELERGRLASASGLGTREQKDWESWLNFWRGRVGGSKTMVDSVEAEGRARSLTLAALNIGSAHTNGVAKLLTTRNLGFVVLTPLVTRDRDDTGDLEAGMDRKYARRSVFTSGFLTSALAETFKKPEPVIDEPWFQAKSECYWMIDKVVSGVLMAGGGGGVPPFGFTDQDLRGLRVAVDPRLISIENNGPEDSRRAVVFPIQLNPGDSRIRRTLWVKAVAGLGAEQSPTTVEAMLQAAFRQIRTEPKAPRAVDDSRGQIQVSTRALATMAPSRDAVRRKVLSTV